MELLETVKHISLYMINHPSLLIGMVFLLHLIFKQMLPSFLCQRLSPQWYRLGFPAIVPLGFQVLWGVLKNLFLHSLVVHWCSTFRCCLQNDFRQKVACRIDRFKFGKHTRWSMQAFHVVFIGCLFSKFAIHNESAASIHALFQHRLIFHFGLFVEDFVIFISTICF